jgi:hypothetical protein
MAVNILVGDGREVLASMSRRPILRPVVVCRENPDGSLSWPCACGGFSHWHVVRTLAEIPEGYVSPMAQAS